MKFHPLIEENKKRLHLIFEENEVDQAYFFGSILGSDFNNVKSDIDIAINLEISDPLVKGETLVKIWNNLEKIFQRKVDLVTPESLRNPVLKQEIERTKKLFYDRKRIQIYH